MCQDYNHIPLVALDNDNCANNLYILFVSLIPPFNRPILPRIPNFINVKSIFTKSRNRSVCC